MSVEDLERSWQARLLAPRTAAVRLIVVHRSGGRHVRPDAVEVAAPMRCAGSITRGTARCGCAV